MIHLSKTSWDELLDTLRDIVLLDKEKLENSISYYKKQFENPNTDKLQLEKLYQRIQWDTQRISYIDELVNRLYTFDFVAIAASLQNAIKCESLTKGSEIENWTFTIRKQNDLLTTYFNPIS